MIFVSLPISTRKWWLRLKISKRLINILCDCILWSKVECWIVGIIVIQTSSVNVFEILSLSSARESLCVGVRVHVCINTCMCETRIAVAGCLCYYYHRYYYYLAGHTCTQYTREMTGVCLILRNITVSDVGLRYLLFAECQVIIQYSELMK